MSVWKKLKNQDAYVSSYNAKKRWTLSPSELEGLGIKFLPAIESYRETDCSFRLANCTFKLNTPSVLDCSFSLVASALECTLNLNASLISVTNTPTPTATNTFTPTPTATNTFTPTPTLDCTLSLNASSI